MSVTQTKDAFLVNGGASVSLSSMVTVSTSGSNPTYLVLTALDRNEYTAAATGNLGNLQGNGQELDFSQQEGDANGASIVFTYQTSTKRYYNSTYGYLDQMTYTAPDSKNDVTDLSLFSTTSSTLAKASSDKLTALALSTTSGVTLATTATVIAEPVVQFTSLPSQATPGSISAVAESFIGKAWNEDGCWVLASSIAAEAGAPLPPITALVGVAGKAYGEWIVAFNGPGNQASNWQSLLVPGEMVVFADSTTSGHIATVVSGSGTSAMLVDNITYQSVSGTILNPANDGSDSDVKISAPHSALAEFSGVSSKTVVIYELDAPVVSLLKTTDSLILGNSQALSTLFHGADPGNKSITKYQVYDSLSSDSFLVGKVAETANSADSALTVTSLSTLKLVAGGTSGTDAVEVRAFNGTYWGDWTTLDVAVGQAPAKAPVLAHQIPGQTWTQGQAVSFTLAGSTFTDPNNQALTYSASLSTGSALPSWLTFNSGTETFSGTVPTGTQNLSLAVTATDVSGLSVKDVFSVTVNAPAVVVTGPVVSHVTATQAWAPGKFVFLTLPSNTFTEAGATLTYTEQQLSGPDVSSWLHFNASGETLSGWVPHLATGTAKLEIIATDAAGHSAADIFTALIGLSALGGV